MTNPASGAPPRPLAALLDEYKEFLTAERGLAAGTVRTYASCINVCMNIIGERIGREVLATDLLDRENIRAYLRGHVAKLSSGRDGNYRASVGGLVDWLMAEGHIPYGPNHIKATPAPKRTTKTKRDRRLSVDEIRAVLGEADGWHPLYRFLFLFMLETNLRISEVVGTVDHEPLRWSAVRWDEEVVRFNNYKGREHGLSVPLTPELRAILTAWKDVYEKDLAKLSPGLDRVPIKGSWFIFPALRGLGKAPKGRRRRMILNPTSRLTEPRAITMRLFKATGIYQGPGDSWHMVGRKTGGNAVKQVARDLNRGDSLELAQAALHHKDSRTTLAYLDPDADYNRYHDFRMQYSIWDDDLLSEIPELRPAHEARKAQEPKIEPVPDQPEALPPGGKVIPFASRRRA